MGHVRLDEVASTQCAVERQLTCEHTGGDDARKLARIVARRFGVCAAHAKKVEHGRLRVENSTATNGADLDGGHGDGDLEIAIDTILVSFVQFLNGRRVTYLFMMVMQLLDSTTWAGSWPVARKMAATMLAA
jgi:hypothetical protein